jgi:DNA (cytosine-5)-methyltransferase 1
MPNAVVDLFCGVGGLSHGLQLAGLRIVAGIDNEESCRYAYETNNHAPFLAKDITAVSPEEIEALFPDLHVRILVGCAPCQPFSKYTKRYRKDGHMDNKWQLLYSFGHLAGVVLPDIVSMENVPELAREQVFQDFVDTLQIHGYSVYHDVVYCPDYGVPQHRKRLVLLASLHGEIVLIPSTHDPEHYRTVRQSIEWLPHVADGERDSNDIMHRASGLSEINRRRIRHSVPKGTWRDWPLDLQLTCHKKASGRSYPSVYGRMHWDEPSPTITTQFYGLGNGRFGPPEQDRALSLREGAILQSFPSDYAFAQDTQHVNMRRIGTQIGNAVPVELGHAIGRSIIQHLREVGLND